MTAAFDAWADNFDAQVDELRRRVDKLTAQVAASRAAHDQYRAWIEDQLDQVAHREPAEYVNREELRGY